MGAVGGHQRIEDLTQPGCGIIPPSRYIMSARATARSASCATIQRPSSRRDVQATAELEVAYRLFEGMGALGRLAQTREALYALGRRAPRTSPRRSTLTARQWQIAELASHGMTDAAIADSLGISRRTATTHMHNILRSLGLQSRLELGRWIVAHEADRAVALADMM